MAFLKQAKTEEQVKSLTVAGVKKAYYELSSDYNKLINLDYVYCPCCGEFKSASGFYSSKKTKSGLEHLGCKSCILDMATDYDKKTGIRSDNKEKTIEVFKKLDLPFVESAYNSALDSVNEAVNEKNRSTAFQQLLVMVKSLPQWNSLTFKDSEFLNEFNDELTSSNRKPRKEVIKLFGSGFSNEDYLYLQDQYDDWRERTQVDSKSQETYIIRICFKLLDIWKAQKAGKDTKDLDRSLNDLMASANLQPRQNVGNAATDSLTFGQLIEKWELEKPIPEPSPEFADVDGIGQYIRIWFSGWLAKAVGLNNVYSQEFDEYMKKYTVTKPEHADEENSDVIYEKLFGKDGE